VVTLDKLYGDGYMQDPVKVGQSSARNMTFSNRMHFAHFGLSYFLLGLDTAVYYDDIGLDY
jgi:hypothetical protein